MAKENIKDTFSFCQALAKTLNEKVAANPETKLSKEELMPLAEPFTEVIDFIKTYLIMAADTLYGSVLMSIDSDVDFKIRNIIDLDIKGTNFKMKFNPLFLGDYKLSELITKTVSEILRLIYEHPAVYANINSERDKGTHSLLEDAGSAQVSSLIANDIRLDRENDRKTLNMPNDMYTVSHITKDTDVRPANQESIEYYYHILKKFKKNPPPGGGMSDEMIPMDAIASPNNDSGEDAHNWETKDSEKTSEAIKSLIHNVYENMDSKARGKVPNAIIQQIERMLAKPEISWKDVLRKYIGTIPYPHRKTRKRLNRKQPERADLCGRLPKRKVNIVICIDTSGSMSDDDLEYCMNEVFHIAKANDTTITIIECDAQVGRVYQAKKPSDIRPDLTGRGGTYFTPAIEYINKDGKFRDALMIYFTDGYGESEIPKPLTYRNLWVVLNDVKCLSLKEPYGEVKSLKMDGDYKKFKQRR